MNDKVQAAAAGLEASVSQTLAWLAARKDDPVSVGEVDSAVRELVAPMTDALAELCELTPEREAALANCILACTEVPDGNRRDDNILSWRYQRESFAQNVAEVGSWTRWATKAIRTAAAARASEV